MVSKWTSELYNFEDKYFQGSVNICKTLRIKPGTANIIIPLFIVY